MRFCLSLCAAATAAVLMVAGGAIAQDVIKARKDGFQGNRSDMGAIKGIIDKGEPVAGVVAPAQRMVAFSARIPTLFPPGSDTGDTKAKPAIWSNKADFEAKAKDFGAAAQKLAELAQAGDAAGVKAQFGVVGKTCGACHDSYRN